MKSNGMGLGIDSRGRVIAEITKRRDAVIRMKKEDWREGITEVPVRGRAILFLRHQEVIP